MKLTKGTYKIKRPPGCAGDAAAVQEGWLGGSFAVTKRAYGPANGELHWVVTHVPSGTSCGGCRSKADAVALMEILDALPESGSVRFASLLHAKHIDAWHAVRDRVLALVR